MPHPEMFEHVIGKDLNDPAVQLLLRSLQGRQDTSDLEGEFSIETPEHGLAFKFDEGSRLSSIFFEEREILGNDAPASRRLPRGLAFSMSRAAVHARLGQPTVSRDTTSSTTGDRLTWDRYDWKDLSLHVQYRDEGTSIGLVTMMAPWRVPR